jgi:hypothetical protein
VQGGQHNLSGKNNHDAMPAAEFFNEVNGIRSDACRPC